jgi:hypothetical protein
MGADPGSSPEGYGTPPDFLCLCLVDVAKIIPIRVVHVLFLEATLFANSAKSSMCALPEHAV